MPEWDDDSVMLISVLLSMLLALGASPPSTGHAIVIAAAGDIACDTAGNHVGEDVDDAGPGCAQEATARLIERAHVAAVLPLGDTQYPNGAYDDYLTGYGPSWGRLNALVHPAVGNHEYHQVGASGYFRYFGARAGDPQRGYYSYDLGGWHFVALNGNCWNVGGCGAGSQQERWLHADLAAHHARCTLAYWHQPRFSSGHHGSDAAYDAFWRDLYAAHAAIVLDGHDHDYERFAPQSPDGVADANGIREFVVGTGGKSHYVFRTPITNSQVRDNRDFGALLLTLESDGYRWAFTSIGGRVVDSGTSACPATAAASSR